MKTRQRNIEKARAIYQAQPFLTKTYMAINYKFPISFLQANWEEITKGGDK